MKEKQVKYVAPLEEYPRNLLAAINAMDQYEWYEKLFNADGEQISFDATVPGDKLGSLEYILYTIMPREKMALEMMYKYGMHLYEVGNELGVSPERARQIIAKALRKLRHPSRMKYIDKGIAGVITYEKTVSYSIGKEEGFKNGYRVRQAEESGEPGTVTQCDDITIEELNLSVRSYNCLKRAGIDTVYDLSNISYDDLLHLRNLGRKSYEEILSKVRAAGFHLKENIT